MLGFLKKPCVREVSFGVVEATGNSAIPSGSPLPFLSAEVGSVVMVMLFIVLILLSIFFSTMSIVLGGGFGLLFVFAHLGMCLSATSFLKFLEQNGHCCISMFSTCSGTSLNG